MAATPLARASVEKAPIWTISAPCAVAIGRGADKSPLARELGARVYIDNKEKDPAAELQKLFMTY